MSSLSNLKSGHEIKAHEGEITAQSGTLTVGDQYSQVSQKGRL